MSSTIHSDFACHGYGYRAEPLLTQVPLLKMLNFRSLEQKFRGFIFQVDQGIVAEIADSEYNQTTLVLIALLRPYCFFDNPLFQILHLNPPNHAALLT